ncbi:hypothetical protein A2954_06310 [Candidatus Roizmanbacteria bacterium RIFCSPLOWO2_01_FULL_37_12]|uniref:DUF4386 domain-containing protein n=1 Tax=Candidatus Roizmanbacteria bacterium RIFCSPLOWO2_01_FULL_37_12 TaxID=1802056 RepID=A0A1F7IAW7_9BACT|nr:MAG: hypothetical protein A2768_01650 [Candidatus Roizmanbacteria bacterium RIFCSPHIGHO2_01_FULL_37_16]OGK25769.1 MAG: hypothetical protein A3D76_02155 [Candidatus Roizmanbacteria bacterium RIFCSPHIGHO2_02_FULL_37_9b]OGK40470.1 MAG: hypothetical protein A2954_06310 [Candidatus Roizmanbacteria bacterium RIFCSPLOWO2_01_FULL_37_12]
MNKSVAKIGYWSALSTTVFAVIYIIPQLVIGIEMPDSMITLVLILTPSLFLAPSFLVMMTAIHYYANEDKKIWSHIGTLFAVAYMVFVSIVYFTVLTVTMPHMLQGEIEAVALLKYIPKSFMTGIDALGYTSMSLATLFAAFSLNKSKLEVWIKRFFIANGVIAPIILLTQVYPIIAYAGALWIITMPMSSFLTMKLFKTYINK